MKTFFSKTHLIKIFLFSSIIAASVLLCMTCFAAEADAKVEAVYWFASGPDGESFIENEESGVLLNDTSLVNNNGSGGGRIKLNAHDTAELRLRLKEEYRKDYVVTFISLVSTEYSRSFLEACADDLGNGEYSLKFSVPEKDFGVSIVIEKRHEGGPEKERTECDYYGTWIFSEEYDEWSYVVNGEKLRDQWAFLYNEYGNVAEGQQVFSLFYFNGSGVMVTGDMIIDGKLYSFNSKKDGTRGRLLGYTPPF